jgi:hypothetical protein
MGKHQKWRRSHSLGEAARWQSGCAGGAAGQPGRRKGVGGHSRCEGRRYTRRSASASPLVAQVVESHASRPFRPDSRSVRSFLHRFHEFCMSVWLILIHTVPSSIQVHGPTLLDGPPNVENGLKCKLQCARMPQFCLSCTFDEFGHPGNGFLCNFCWTLPHHIRTERHVFPVPAMPS